MPKLKTNKAVRKRFKVSKNGKVRMNKTKRRHLLGDKTSGAKRRLRGWSGVDETNAKQVREALPYG